MEGYIKLLLDLLRGKREPQSVVMQWKRKSDELAAEGAAYIESIQAALVGLSLVNEKLIEMRDSIVDEIIALQTHAIDIADQIGRNKDLENKLANILLDDASIAPDDAETAVDQEESASN